jgi:hypothetical protein
MCWDVIASRRDVRFSLEVLLFGTRMCFQHFFDSLGRESLESVCSGDLTTSNPRRLHERIHVLVSPVGVASCATTSECSAVFFKEELVLPEPRQRVDVSRWFSSHPLQNLVEHLLGLGVLLEHGLGVPALAVPWPVPASARIAAQFAVLCGHVVERPALETSRSLGCMMTTDRGSHPISHTHDRSCLST